MGSNDSAEDLPRETRCVTVFHGVPSSQNIQLLVTTARTVPSAAVAHGSSLRRHTQAVLIEGSDLGRGRSITKLYRERVPMLTDSSFLGGFPRSPKTPTGTI